jgi:transcription elongation factor
MAGINVGDGLEANIDRMERDTALRDKTVMVTKGPLKGYKGTVSYANETMAHVHIHSKCEKFTVPIKDIFIVFNDSDFSRIQSNAMN